MAYSLLLSCFPVHTEARGQSCTLEAARHAWVSYVEAAFTASRRCSFGPRLEMPTSYRRLGLHHCMSLSLACFLQVLEVWSTWHALGMQHQNFALIKSFLQDLSKALHRRLGFDGEPMVRLLLAQNGQLSISLTAALAFSLSLHLPGATGCALAMPNIKFCHVSTTAVRGRPP